LACCCAARKNDAVVRYVLGDKSEQIFASRYQFALPSEDDLRAEIRREMEQFQPLDSLEPQEPLQPLAPSKPLEQREETSAKVQRAATGKPKTPATQTTKSRSKSTAAKGTKMSQREVNAIAGRLSLRKPQTDSLQALARAIEASPLVLKHGRDSAELADVLKVLQGQFGTLKDFERDFPRCALRWPRAWAKRG
jgi:hypothetical protein